MAKNSKAAASAKPVKGASKASVKKAAKAATPKAASKAAAKGDAKKEPKTLAQINVSNVLPDHVAAVEAQLRTAWNVGELDADSIEAAVEVDDVLIEGIVTIGNSADGCHLNFQQK